MGVTKTQVAKPQNNEAQKNKRKRNNKPKKQIDNERKENETKPLNGNSKLPGIADLDKQVNGKSKNKNEKKKNSKPASAEQKSGDNGVSTSPDKNANKKAKKRNRKNKNVQNSGPEKSPEKASDALNDSTQSNSKLESIKNKRQKKKEKTKQKLLVFKDKVAQAKEGALKPDEIKLESINQKIAAIGSNPQTNTAKRRLRKLLKLKALAEGKPTSNEVAKGQGSGKASAQQTGKASKSKKRKERRDGNVEKEIAEQKLQNEIWENDTKKNEDRLQQTKSKAKKPKLSKPEVKTVEEDSDYEVEHMVKADKVTKKLSAKVPMDSEDDDEDDDSEEMQVDEDSDAEEGEEGSDVQEEESDAEELEDNDEEGSDVELEEADDDDEEDSENENDDDDDDDDDDDNDNDNDKESDNENVNVVIDSKKTAKKQSAKEDNKKKLNILNKIQEKKNNKGKDGGNKTKEKSQVNEKVVAEKLKKLVGNNPRYVVFVGNLPYSIEKNELQEHFSKAGEIRDVRMVTERGTNKPRGIAYVELQNPESYQKALSLHHTMLGGRRINVLYTQPGHKKSAEAKKAVKSKNFKLDAMRKLGMLAGSTKEGKKRSDRRKKANGQGAKKQEA